MNHMMGLYDEPFALMKNGRKTVEVRLNDEKRQRLRVGDHIDFIKAPVQDDRLKMIVTELKKFESFRELYESVPIEDLGEEGMSVNQLLNETYLIYSQESEQKFGALAIYVEQVE
ncbi:ASCH domain-containing protein [Alkalicoccobacillus porphyridii]|nr:ASCH domain-containing protein [Alkalicoccobacillus porphyridii]